MAVLKHVIFKVGEEEFGSDIQLISAIESYGGVVPVPNAPGYILGILNLRGEVIPVFSLRKKFGLQESEINDKTQLIITKYKDMKVGFKVDSVSEIEEIDDTNLHEMPVIVRTDATNYAKQVANIDGRMIILIDHEGILSSEEARAVGEVVNNQKEQEI